MPERKEGVDGDEEVLDLTQSHSNFQIASAVAAAQEMIVRTPSPPKQCQEVRAQSATSATNNVQHDTDVASICGDYFDFDPDDEDLLELEAAFDIAPAKPSGVIDLDGMMASARSAGGVIDLEDDDMEEAKEGEGEDIRDQRSALSWIEASQQFWLHPQPKTKPSSNPHRIQEDDLVRFMWEGYDGETVWTVGQVSSMNGDGTIVSLLAQMHPYEATGILYRNEGNTAIAVPLENLQPYEGGPESFVDEREEGLGKRPRPHDSQHRSPEGNRSSGTTAKQRRR